jgi:hypothetical protein
MIAKKTKKLPMEFVQALAVLASRPEYKTFVSLADVEENNIVVQAFKIKSSHPDLARKKAHLEGRLYELKKILRTFEDALKKVKKDE